MSATQKSWPEISGHVIIGFYHLGIMEYNKKSNLQNSK